MLDFVYVTFFKCLYDIILLQFLYIRPMHIFVMHRKGQVIGVTSVVLTLVFQSNDVVFCHCFFFVFCILELAYVAWEPVTLYNDIAWLLNQDTCQLRYKSWILSAPFAKQFHANLTHIYITRIMKLNYY